MAHACCLSWVDSTTVATTMNLSPPLRLATLALALAVPWHAHAQPTSLCGAALPTPSSPADLANVPGDLSLAHVAEQPASLVTCAQGYFAAKCGDHALAHRIFDKCIAKGYAGAMIWKGLLLEEGMGMPPDPAKAAALYRQAADSGTDGYATLGKLHYASALYEGRGVARDEAAARRWFAAAAAEGSAEAAEFLKTGYHTGSRDRGTAGVGTPQGNGEPGARVLQQAPSIALPQGLAGTALAGLLLALVGAGALAQQRRAARAPA